MENSKPQAERQAPAVLRIHPRDNVFVATRPLAAGTTIEWGGLRFALTRDVALGAKLATDELPAGAKILKFGEPIGTLQSAVRLGDYIHSHNLESDYLPTHARGEFVNQPPQ